MKISVREQTISSIIAQLNHPARPANSADPWVTAFAGRPIINARKLELPDAGPGRINLVFVASGCQCSHVGVVPDRKRANDGADAHNPNKPPSLRPRPSIEFSVDDPDSGEIALATAKDADDDANTSSLERASDWASLAGDFSRSLDEPRFTIHDRTHLEWAIDYPFKQGDSSQHTFEWEAYFFAPESLRIDQRTYDKQDVYSDLQSYVRFAIPRSTVHSLRRGPLDRMRALIARCTDDEKARTELLRDMRLFACTLRGAGVAERNRIVKISAHSVTTADAAAEALAEDTQALLREFRAILAPVANFEDRYCTAARWVDEDVSRLTETLFGHLALTLAEQRPDAAIVNQLKNVALAEARYRNAQNLDTPLGSRSSLELERLEFRRHVLKRFTSSVLWLRTEIKPASAWVLQLLYALAAGVAMAFATAAAVWNGNDIGTNGFFQWMVVAILAYAAKDRIKAVLQTAFANVVSRHFPDRSWRIHLRDEHAAKGLLGRMEEQSGFLPFHELPPEILSVRRATRTHELEEEARPETVLFHRKEIELEPKTLAQVDARFDALTEIFRLDLRRWLAHTDDPKREFIFADPARGTVEAAKAPRVYNIAVIYRLRGAGEDAAWRRLRVVVTRKGIRRLETIVLAPSSSTPP